MVILVFLPFGSKSDISTDCMFLLILKKTYQQNWWGVIYIARPPSRGVLVLDGVGGRDDVVVHLEALLFSQTEHLLHRLFHALARRECQRIHLAALASSEEDETHDHGIELVHDEEVVALYRVVFQSHVFVAVLAFLCHIERLSDDVLIGFAGHLLLLVPSACVPVFRFLQARIAD